ncbi:MAG: FAD-dependent oxidoreductase, partial [Bacilli bacterium]
NSRKIGITNENNPDVVGGIDFLRDVNLGKGRKLTGTAVVVGGGNVAIDVARTALRQGAEKVHLYCLESREEMPSSKDEIIEAEEEGIIIHNGFGPKEIVVTDGKLTAINFKKCVRVFDKDHRFNPEYDENTTELAPCNITLLAIGQSFDYGKIFEGTNVALTRRQTVIADPYTYQTNEPDIFVGGDILNGPSFAIVAIADGKQAAISLHRFVQPGQTLDAGREHRNFKDHLIDLDNIDFSGFDKAPRQIPAVGAVDTTSYKDNRGILTTEQLEKEADRCLKCGRAIVDQNLCVGCGQCAIQCKFDAAHLIKRTSIYAKGFESMLPQAAGHMVKRTIKIAAKAIHKD